MMNEMVSIARPPEPEVPYTFHTMADSQTFFDLEERRGRPFTGVEVIGDVTWRWLPRAGRTDFVSRLLVVLGPLLGGPVPFALARQTWTLAGIEIGIVLLPVIFRIVWMIKIPKAKVAFDWQTRMLRWSPADGVAFDELRLELAAAPHGTEVWARSPRAASRLVGLFHTEPVAAAYCERLTTLMRDGFRPQPGPARPDREAPTPALATARVVQRRRRPIGQAAHAILPAASSSSSSESGSAASVASRNR
jgi:hypothetical protein